MPEAPRPVAGEAGTEAAPAYRGAVIIEWPPRCPYAMSGCAVEIFDAATGKPFTTVMATGITVRTDADANLSADLVMFAGQDGEPLFGGEPELDGDAWKQLGTGVFSFLVSEMRVREPAQRRKP